MTPINHIKGVTKIFEKEFANNQDVNNKLKIQSSAIDQVECMILDMMDLAQIRLKTFKFVNAKYNLRASINQIINKLQIQCDVK